MRSPHEMALLRRHAAQCSRAGVPIADTIARAIEEARDAGVLGDDHDCDGCSECSCDDVVCGTWLAENACYKRGAIVTKDGRWFRAERSTHIGQAPGLDDGVWIEVSAPAPTRPRSKASPMTWQKFASGIAGAVKDWAQVTFARVDRLDALERRVAALEGRDR